MAVVVVAVVAFPFSVLEVVPSVQRFAVGDHLDQMTAALGAFLLDPWVVDLVEYLVAYHVQVLLVVVDLWVETGLGGVVLLG